jgi:tagaturonate reductase
MSSTAETVLQFGAGRFLRGFVDRFLQNANDAGQAVGQVVVVQSTPGARAALLNQQPDGYHVLVRGYQDGKLVEGTEHVRCVKRALTATEQWADVLAVAKSPALRYIVSNATEAGYATDDSDRPDSAPPASMPAKLTQCLWHRFQAGAPPIVLLPCELFEQNAAKLLELVAGLARKWELPAPFETWLRERCRWLNSLVDCMITNVPADHPLLKEDPLAIHAEPYALWAIEKPKAGDVGMFTNPAIHVVDDLQPYYLRKVRILNGIHTAMVGKFLPAGFVTVQQVLADSQGARWVRDVIFEEIVPVLAYRVNDVAAFADETYDRLRNPFLQHLLSDIRLNHAAKVKLRLQTTHDEYAKLFGKPPRRIAEAMAYQP